MKRYRTEGYEKERVKIEIESSITDSKLMGRSRTAYNWIPDNIKNHLDVGSSWNLLNYLSFYNKSNQYIFAMDIDQSKVIDGRKYFSNVFFICSDIQTTPFKTNSFDLVTIMDVLEHVGNDKKAIEEIWRILQPEDVLILSVPHSGAFDFLDPDNLLFIRLYKIMIRLNALCLDRYYLNPHKHYTLKELKILFEDKFKIVKIHRGGFIFNPISFLIFKFISLIFIYFNLRKIKWINIIRINLQKLLDKVKELEYRIDFKEEGYHCTIYAYKEGCLK